MTFDAHPSSRPNIVFVLTDDLSNDLVRFMPQVARLKRDGMSFSRYYVTDSLCCPSRSSIFTGELPHDTGVTTNEPPEGGYAAFFAHGDERRSFARSLQRRGYDTALMGKFLNGYQPADGPPGPGWTHWSTAGNGYPELGYRLDVDGRASSFGHRPRDYLTDVLTRQGSRFIRAAATRHHPFMLELATFAPHRPAIPAPRDRHRLPGLRAPRGPAYDVATRHAPAWLAHRPRLSARLQARLDRNYRRRARSVLAVDDLLRRIRAVLAQEGVARDTYVVFSSDNGYHMGQHRLDAGKRTAFDTDIHVPLVIAGPGVRPGGASSRLAENVDLAPTFDRLAGAPVPATCDGHSLTGLLLGARPRRWRDAVLVEHTRPRPSPIDPDEQPPASGDPPTYQAIRTRTGTYVEYADGGREYYDQRADPNELDNAYDRLRPAARSALHRTLQRLATCHGGRSCWRAARLPPAFR
jgi:N-acetylglucosamine-6-sulfatase